MEVRTYRGRTMHEALALVRRDLGMSAAVLHTREVRGGWPWRFFPGLRQIEITASNEVHVPSRLPPRPHFVERDAPESAIAGSSSTVQAAAPASLQEDVRSQLRDLQTMVEGLYRAQRTGTRQLPQELFDLYTGLIDAEVTEELARELVERVRDVASPAEWADPELLAARMTSLIEDEITVSGPIRITPGRRRLVALVGPTGVGKTTTIAKLAANFRLRDKRRVGLITVDTYRIAAVEQLRTYAEIIDLPMQVVSTPHEMRQAIEQMSGLDLVLLDTAGRSPRDEVQIQELKTLLQEAAADEVHLVLGSATSAATLERTAERFATVGTTALILTKLDEAHGLGNVLPLLRTSKLPISYLTDGQNVPDDIAAADVGRVARMILGAEC